MVKAVKYTFRGMNQDITNSKVPVEFFYSATNIRFTTTSEVITGGLAYEKGNKKQIDIPNITISNGVITYGSKQLIYRTGKELDALQGTSTDNKIIGYSITRDSTIVFTTGSSVDAIWEIKNEDFTLTLLYVAKFNFSIDNPIQTIFNYENSNIQKIYWLDGKHQIRSINIKHELIEGNSKLIDVPSNSMDFVANVSFSQPKLKDLSYGGNHTSGVIQYAYNLYRLNSSQTKISPLSEMIPLGKGSGQGGGEVNEVVGTTPIIEIKGIDTSYTHLKVYAIKYTSFNEVPSISLIEEREISGSGNVTIHDDGTTIADLSLEEFVFLGSNPIIPSHIEAKDNILFPVNVKEKFFDVDLDVRAFSFKSGGANAKIKDSAGVASYVTNPDVHFVPPKFDCINADYDTYKYHKNGTTLGAEGKYLKLEIVQKNLTNPEKHRVLKDQEIYRFGIEFYNKLGQSTPPKWICDYKMPVGNLKNLYNTLKVELKPAFQTWLDGLPEDDNKPVGYRILRADRNFADRTIIAQGLMGSMLFQVKGNEAKSGTWPYSIKKEYEDDTLKMPSYIIRNFATIPTSPAGGTDNGVLQPVNHLNWVSSGSANEGGEVTSSTTANNLSQTFQHTKIMQFYSPEVMFEMDTSIPAGMNLRVKGILSNTENGVYAREYDITNKTERYGGKTLGGLNPFHVPSNQWLENNEFNKLLNNSNVFSSTDNDRAFIGPAGDKNSMDHMQFYREFTTFEAAPKGLEYPIYGAPEITERGAGARFYNNDPRYNYTNSLQSFYAPGKTSSQNEHGAALTGINSYGSKCATIVLGNKEMSTTDRRGLEQLYSSEGFTTTSGAMLAEIKRPAGYEYTGGIYGGNTYEDKLRTTYLAIGEYKKTAETSVQIDSPGDIFVQDYTFLRIGKTDIEVYSNTQAQISEVVKCRVETVVDLKHRHDISLSSWDARFQPKDQDFHKYNKVYSQEPSLIQVTPFDFTFKKIKNFDSRVIATKTKIPNETVDSWTDILPNTALDLDGKYGPINGVANFKDNLYVFQDSGVAILGINPRVQTQGTDGIAIELGSGQTLHDYQYLATGVGSINKWGIVTTNNGIYWLDALNKSFMKFSGEGMQNLSSLKGMHSYFQNNIVVKDIRPDNPLTGNGVSIGYDQTNTDVYLSYKGEWTLCFNERLDQFSGFYSYDAPIYIFNKEKFLTINPNDLGEIFETHAGDYNIFYGANKESKLVFLCNPEPDVECTFNNIEYKSEAYNSNEVEQRYTWEKVRVYNEFQDSGVRVITTDMLRKLGRKYRMALPRNAASTDRIRNTWAFIELIANNNDKLKFLNHDIILYYVPNYVRIQ